MPTYGVHPEAQSQHFDTYPQHLFLPRALCQGFETTYARDAEGDKAWFAFLKPLAIVAEAFAIDREVLAVVSPYEEFQPRVLQLAQATIKRFAPRLDPDVFLIVGQDPRFVDRVVSWGEELGASAIPVLQADLETGPWETDRIRSLLQTYLFSRDLFGYTSPVFSDHLFFGRMNMVRELAADIVRGKNVGLFGLRKMGKTSVIKRLIYENQTRNDMAIVYIDAQTPAVHEKGATELLAHIASEIRLAVQEATGVNLRLQLRGKLTTMSKAAEAFDSDIRKALKALSSDTPQRQRLVIVIDEVDYITPRITEPTHWNDDFIPFWQTLRSIHQRTDGGLSFVLAGVNPLAVEQSYLMGAENPIFQAVPATYLPPFNREATRTMIRKLGRRMGMHLQEASHNVIQTRLGGHPFLIRQFCSLLHKRFPKRPATIGVEQISQCFDDFARHADDQLDQILDVLRRWYPDEFDMLVILADGDVDGFRALAESEPRYVNHIEGYGLIHPEGQGLQFAIELLGPYLKKRIRRKPATIQAKPALSDKWQRLSAERNALERDLRKFVKDGLQVGGKRKPWHLLVEDGLSEKSRARINNSGVGKNQLLDELYFLDLRDVVSSYWDIFKDVFRNRDNFASDMNVVNAARADAHAKGISEESYEHAIAAIGRLRKQLD